MSNLVDTFIICSKFEWMERINNLTDINKKIMLNLVPDKYRDMFRALLQRFDSLDSIMDNHRNPYWLDEVYGTAEKYETNDVMFSNKYRGDCLLQVIRMTFYDTLLIVESDYNENKHSYFIIVHTNHVISQSHWERSIPKEFVFTENVVGSFAKPVYDNVFALPDRRHLKSVTGV